MGLDELGHAVRRPGVGIGRRHLRGFGQQGSSAPAPPAWDPASLTNLRADWDAAEGVTLSGSVVPSWADKSGVGNVLSSASDPVRPTFTASGFNGTEHPYISGDGTSHWLRDETFSWGGTISAMTVAVVIHVPSPITGRTFLQAQSVTNINTDGGGLVTAFGPNNITSTGVSALTSARLMTFAWDGGIQRLYIGTTQEDIDVNATAAPFGSFFSLFANVVGTAPSNARVARLWVMRAAITGDELASLDTYCARYGV